MDLFSSYVMEIYDLRKRYELEGKTAWANCCKLLLNSLAGKFGQWDHRWGKCDDFDPPTEWGRFDTINYDTGKVEHYRAIAGLVEKENLSRVREITDFDGNRCRETGGPLLRAEYKHSFPAICAFVNSYARMQIWRALEVANESGKVWYSAVDSI